MGHEIDADRKTYETAEIHQFISTAREGRVHQISGGACERSKKVLGLVHGFQRSTNAPQLMRTNSGVDDNSDAFLRVWTCFSHSLFTA